MNRFARNIQIDHSGELSRDAFTFGTPVFVCGTGRIAQTEMHFFHNTDINDNNNINFSWRYLIEQRRFGMGCAHAPAGMDACLAKAGAEARAKTRDIKEYEK